MSLVEVPTKRGITRALLFPDRSCGLKPKLSDYSAKPWPSDATDWRPN
jgi:hypothetical protein